MPGPHSPGPASADDSSQPLMLWTRTAVSAVPCRPEAGDVDAYHRASQATVGRKREIDLRLQRTQLPVRSRITSRTQPILDDRTQVLSQGVMVCLIGSRSGRTPHSSQIAGVFLGYTSSSVIKTLSTTSDLAMVHTLLARTPASHDSKSSSVSGRSNHQLSHSPRSVSLSVGTNRSS